MNCKEFQRRLLEEPGSEDPEFLAHAKRCAECRADLVSALEFEERLKAALRQAPPSNAVDHTPGNRRHLLLGSVLGLAALFLVAFVVLRIQGSPAELPRLVTRHIHAEPELLSRQRPLDPMQVASVMASQQYGMRRLPLAVVAAAPCWIRSGRGIHLVMQGSAGPVTILIMPAERLDGARPVQEPPLEGLVMPAVQGSVAVVAESPADLEESLGYLRENLLWRGRPALVRF
ncbi:MAG: hypothetical protein DSZ02_01755 [Gammaproteobacteria bacterium]|nr:MAG: hypothetical protein DSZ02_01755 [Gammaproteobacteria bacterium]